MRLNRAWRGRKTNSKIWASLLLMAVGEAALGCRGSGASSASDARLDASCAPCPPCASNAPEPVKQAKPGTREDAGVEIGTAVPLDASPPFTGKLKEEPLSATADEWVEFLTRAAKYRGKDVDRATWQDVLKVSHTPGDSGFTAWGKLCRDVGFPTDDMLRPLCMTDSEWSITLDVADMDGDGKPEYWLFGTWVTFDHHDGLLAIFARNETGLRPIRRPELVPENGPGLTIVRPFLAKTPKGVKLTTTHSGEEVSDPDYVAQGGQGFYRITRHFETRSGAFLLVKESKELSEPEH